MIDDHQNFPDSARQACRSAIEAGHQLLICTGRTVPEIYPWLLEVGFSGILAGNGTYGSLGKRVLFQHFLPADTMDQINQYLSEVAICWAWQNHDGMYPQKNFMEMFQSSSTRQVGTIEGDWSAYWELMAPHLREGLPKRSPKGIFIIPQDAPISIADVQERFKDQASVIWGPIKPYRAVAGEIVPAEINKGRGLAEVMRVLKRPLSQAVAIGDGRNDIEMLQVAGLGIAMGNADQGVAQYANWQTAPIDQDGLAKAFAYAGLI